jgi:hypothetical protein
MFAFGSININGHHQFGFCTSFPWTCHDVGVKREISHALQKAIQLNKPSPNVVSWGTEFRPEVEAGVEVWNWPLELNLKAQPAVPKTLTPNFLI